LVILSYREVKIAPIKSVSIPRLDLTVAVLAVRLDELTRKELELLSNSSYFWVDSTAVLYCIRNISKRFSVFTTNRLATFEKHTKINQWYHVPSKLNPVDAASRGLEAHKVFSTDGYRPTLLLQPQSMWPNSEVVIDEPPTQFLPVKAQTVQTVIVTEHPTDIVNQLMYHCSNFNKLKRLPDGY